MMLTFLYITFLCFIGFFTYRLGMTGISNSKNTIIESIGGLIIFVSFVLVVLLVGWKALLVLLVVFWLVISPLVELMPIISKRMHHIRKFTKNGASHSDMIKAIHEGDYDVKSKNEITSIAQLNKEQLAKFQTAKDLTLHLHEIGQIKEKPTEEQMEQHFLKRINNDHTRKGV